MCVLGFVGLMYALGSGTMTNGGKPVGRGVLSPTIYYSFEVFVLFVVVWMLLIMQWFCFVQVYVGEGTPRPTKMMCMGNKYLFFFVCDLVLSVVVWMFLIVW